MKVLAPAKINPFLKITGTRPDGYHDLELVFLPITLCDTLYAEPNDLGTLRLTCSDPLVPIESNLITKAYDMVKADHPELGGLDVRLTKIIPSGAGLGGGSADAAVFLKLLEILCSLELSREQLFSYAERLGADVPALLLAEPSLGRGIGEVLTPLECRVKVQLLIVSPGFACSTKEMYGRFDGRTDLQQPENAGALIKAMEEGDLESLCGSLFNVFEQLLDPAQREKVEDLKAEMLRLGARGALMTGSGSCVFGLFEREEERDLAAEVLSRTYGVWRASLLDRNNSEVCD